MYTQIKQIDSFNTLLSKNISFLEDEQEELMLKSGRMLIDGDIESGFIESGFIENELTGGTGGTEEEKEERKSIVNFQEQVDKKFDVLSQLIEINKMSCYTIQGQSCLLTNRIKQKGYIMCLIHKDDSIDFERYFKNRDDIYYFLSDFISPFQFHNICNDYLSLVDIRKSGENNWKTCMSFDKISITNSILDDYKRKCEPSLLEHVKQSYKVLFICNKQCDSIISVEQILLFLLEKKHVNTSTTIIVTIFSSILYSLLLFSSYLFCKK